jgi:hypothetical protein
MIAPMRTPTLLGAALLALASCRSLPAAAEPVAPVLVHSVFFTLKDQSPAAREHLIEDCYRELASIEGITSFYAAARDEGLARDANDVEFDVALTVVFRDRAALDHYLPDERHQRFVAGHKDGWAKVRIFDSRVRGNTTP